MTIDVERLTTDNDGETGSPGTDVEHIETNDDSSAAMGSRSEPEANTSSPARVSFSVRGLIVGVVILLLVAMTGVLGWLYVGSRQALDAQSQRADNYAHAEKTALDYAVNAAAMNASDLAAWKTKLVAGTTPELNDKLSKAATSMEQILVPLQWNSTATPLAAKVRSNEGSIYVVDAFVSVQTKTVQAPDPLQSTAAYSITIDSSNNWQISDVGGIGAMVGGN